MDAVKPSGGGPARERGIFEAALELEGGARAAYLDSACGADGVLRLRVESLLEAAGLGEGILPDAPGKPGGAVGSSVASGGGVLEQPGMSIGRYVLLEEIGEGGCGIVYLAEQREPVRRRVALKILKPGMDTRSVVARFEVERQALALMDHPNIAKVLDGGATATGRPFFVMELIRGVRITEFCDQRRLSSEERLRLFVQVCHAIQHAHQKGVIHRDIKPSNILVTVNDDVAVPKVIDFGIAKATGQSLTDKTLVTRFHGLIGTPAYMSPEQAEFSSVDVDTRSDVYSLGVLLYELLVGKPPFDTGDMLKEGLEGVRRTLRETPATAPSVRLDTFGEAEKSQTAERRRSDVPRLRSELKGDLDWIVLKCLEKDRVRRYESVGALAQDVQRSLMNEPVEARPPTWSYRFGKAVERNRAAFLTGGGLALTLLVAAVFSTAMAWREHAARSVAEVATARAEAEALAAHRAAYAADILSARTALEEGNPGRARSLLAAHVPGADEADLRGVEWRWLSWAARDESMNVLPHAGLVRCLALSPDGKRLASGCTDGRVRIWDGQTLEKLMEIETEARALEYSRDGGLLATVTREGTLLRRSDTWEVVRVIPGLGGPIAFAPDGRHLFGVEGGRWVRWDLEGRERIVPAVPIEGAAPEVVAMVGPDRLVVAARGEDGLITVVSAETGEGRVVLEGLDSVESVAGSADGRWVAAGNWHGTVAVWNARTGALVARLESLRRGAEALGFSRDGGYLFSGGRDQQVRVLRFEPEGEDPLREVGLLRGHSHDVVAMRVGPEGTQAMTASSDTTVRVWDIAARAEEWGPRIPGLNSLIFDFNADATEFHTLGPEGEVATWAGSPPREVGRQRMALVPLASPLGAGDGSVFVGDRTGGLMRWDLKRKRALWQMRRGSSPLVPQAFSPVTGLLVVAEYGGVGRLHLYRPPATQPETTYEDFRGGYTAYTRMAVVSPDGRWLVYPGPDFALMVVDVKSGKLHGRLTGLTWHVGALACSADGRQVAAGSRDGRLMTWEVDSGERRLGPFAAHSASVNHVEYSSDGRTLLTTAHAGGLRLWNAVNGRSMISVPEAESTAAPLLAAGDVAVVYWNLKTGDIERHPAPPLPGLDRHRPLPSAVGR